MNRVVGGTNQIDRLAALGLFETAPATPYKAALVLATRDRPGGIDVEERARSYLHANCGFCHRPDDAELPEHRPAPRCRVQGHATPAARTPERGNQGVPTSLIITPGQPSQSLVVLRMKAPPDDADGQARTDAEDRELRRRHDGGVADRQLDHVADQLPAVAAGQPRLQWLVPGGRVLDDQISSRRCSALPTKSMSDALTISSGPSL